MQHTAAYDNKKKNIFEQTDITKINIYIFQEDIWQGTVMVLQDYLTNQTIFFYLPDKVSLWMPTIWEQFLTKLQIWRHLLYLCTKLKNGDKHGSKT